jgi:hypothetical protein
MNSISIADEGGRAKGDRLTVGSTEGGLPKGEHNHEHEREDNVLQAGRKKTEYVRGAGGTKSIVTFYF